MAHRDVYPPHTRRPESREQDGGDIVVPSGTVVSLLIEANQPLDKAWLALDTGEEIGAVVSDSRAQAALTVTKDARYTIQLQNRGMIRNRDPVTYRIVALPDRAPEVRLLRPGNSELGESMATSVLAEAFDDYGIGRMELRFRLDEKAEDHTLAMEVDRSDKEATANLTWDLSALDLLPGDQIVYRVRAYDNNPIPQFGESQSFVIRFPSLFEIHEDAEKMQQKSLEEMDEVRESSQALAEKLDTLVRELQSDDKLNWQDKQQVEEVIQAQEAMNNQMKQAADQLAETLDKLEESGLLQDDTLQKLEELQELLNQIQTPELQEAMKKLQNAIQTADADMVRKALEEFREEREKFQAAIDRTIALLKRVQQQQTLDALAKKMESLADSQNELTGDIRRDVLPESLAKHQEQIAQDTKNLKDELRASAEQFAESAPTDAQLESLAKEMDDKKLAPRMDDLEESLASATRSENQKSSETLAGDLKKMAEQMKRVRKQFTDLQKAEIAGELNRALHDLLSLSRSQEETVQRADASQTREETAPLALDQARTIAGANRMVERLTQAAEKTFFLPPQAGEALGEALEKMDIAAGHLNSGDAQRAAQEARHAMQAINGAAMIVQRALGQIPSSESGTGFEEMMKQMAQLSEQQGELNGQTQGLFGKPQPGQGGQDLQQLAAQQRAIQKALEQLREELARQQQQVLGDLAKVASDMEQTARELQNRQVTPETIDRQQQILSRMLDAQKSMNQRGKSRKREAASGKDVTYLGPGSLPENMGESSNPLRQYLRDALKEGYPVEYQSLIRRYFESLIEDAPARKAALPSNN